MTTTRIIANADAARIKAALHGHVRFATETGDHDTTFIFMAEEARAAADLIAAELAR